MNVGAERKKNADDVKKKNDEDENVRWWKDWEKNLKRKFEEKNGNEEKAYGEIRWLKRPKHHQLSNRFRLEDLNLDIDLIIQNQLSAQSNL